MTKRACAEAIKACGLVVRFGGFDPMEIRIDYRRDDPRYIAGDRGTAYFTDDRRDAVNTAQLMAKGGR